MRWTTNAPVLGALSCVFAHLYAAPQHVVSLSTLRHALARVRGHLGRALCEIPYPDFGERPYKDVR